MRTLAWGMAALVACVAPAGAATTVLTFDAGTMACTDTDGGSANQICSTDGQLVAGNYGSSAALAVSYDASENTGSRTSLQFTTDHFFTGADGQATSFPPGPASELSQIAFTPAAGFEVSFQSFSWDKLTATSSSEFIFRVIDPMGNEIFSAGNAVTSYTVDSAYFAGPVTFLFGNGGRGAVAVDDIAVDVRAAATPPGVPEPMTWAMLIAGFALTGAASRRRSRRVAIA